MFAVRPNPRVPGALRRAFCSSMLAVLPVIAGCATGVSTTGGDGGDGATGTTTSQGGGGSGGTTTTDEGGGGQGGGGEGGGATTTSSTTTTTSSTTTTTTSSTTTPCLEAPVVAGYTTEDESNGIAALATPLAPGDLGFSAAICPAGDIDVFEIPVTVAGASLRLEVKDKNGACPPGAQTYLRVFDDTGALLAEDTTGGAGNCSLISPTLEPAVASLFEGTYYAQVENIAFAKIDAYVLEATVKAPTCGDGVQQQAGGEQCDDGNLVDGDGCTATCLVEAVCGDNVTHVVAGEQCDDGNILPNDGCSSTCVFEALLLTESEPNSFANPDSLAGFEGVVGAISPIGDQDFFSFEVTVPGSTVTISTSDGLGGCPLVGDTLISLFDANGVLLVSDDDGGIPPCSEISPADDPGASNLPVGTYIVRVEDLGNNSLIDAYVLLVDVSPPGCGDGLLQAGEQCDDDNAAPGDGCSATCQLEGNYTLETEPNPLATPDSVAGFDGAIGAISPANDQDVYTFDVTVPGSSVKIEVSDGIGGCPSFDSEITFYGPGNAVITTDDDDGVSPCSKLDPVVDAAMKNLAPGTYKVMVRSLGAAVPQYVIDIAVKPPSCGDELLAAGEQCDDGNTLPGDGCTDLCQAEAPWEIEPNDAAATAVPLWSGFSQWRGNISSLGDHDYFKLTVLAGQTLTLEAHSVGSTLTCPFDMVMHLVNGAGTEVAMDDDDSPAGLCPLLSPTNDAALGNLPPGAYYVWVQYIADGGTGGPYQIDITLQ